MPDHTPDAGPALLVAAKRLRDAMSSRAAHEWGRSAEIGEAYHALSAAILDEYDRLSAPAPGDDLWIVEVNTEDADGDCHDEAHGPFASFEAAKAWGAAQYVMARDNHWRVRALNAALGATTTGEGE